MPPGWGRGHMPPLLFSLRAETQALALVNLSEAKAHDTGVLLPHLSRVVMPRMWQDPESGYRVARWGCGLGG